MRLTGEGSITQYRQKAIWLAGTTNLRLRQGEPGRWLRDLSDRAYLELDWQQGRWVCSPTVVTKLPSADGLAVIAGFVAPVSLEPLNDLNIDLHLVDSDPGAGALNRPKAKLLQFGAIADLKEAADAINATYVPCSALQLAAKLLPVELGKESAPPNRQNDTIVFFDGARLGWTSPPPDLSKPGLYRYEGNGRRNFLWHEHNSWWHCDMPTGVWTALARTGTSAIRWRPYYGHPPETGQGELFADLGAPLPALHRRCLVLCSGTSPQISFNAGTARYGNVPRAVADDIWQTLGQRSHVLQPA
ncbi:hypothetical protein H7I77_24820 [Mycolicibacterium novocastrense]|nr:hypothetical protein [Mycolicibacterium novocastrense]MCV7026541.1 hypothetical protein [Mycolicibacterium novocastrense]